MYDHDATLAGCTGGEAYAGPPALYPDLWLPAEVCMQLSSAGAGRRQQDRVLKVSG